MTAPPPRMVVMLMPISQRPTPGSCYQNPTIEKCPSCGVDCWMTDRKRILREVGHECLCGHCAIKKYGPHMEVINIAKPH